MSRRSNIVYSGMLHVIHKPSHYADNALYIYSRPFIVGDPCRVHYLATEREAERYGLNDGGWTREPCAASELRSSRHGDLHLPTFLGVYRWPSPHSWIMTNSPTGLPSRTSTRS